MHKLPNNLRRGWHCMLRAVICFSAVGLWGCSAVPKCQTALSHNYATSQSLSALVHELEQEHQAGTFDGVVTVVQGNSLRLQTAYGCADRQLGIPNSATSIFDMGSIAKTFTAAAVLQLVASNQLKLSDTIADYYPLAPALLKPITVQQLLGHSSGLANFHNESDFEAMNKQQAEARILAMPLIAKPGEKVAYSNAGYTLLAGIIEKVSQQSFTAYIRDHLLTPLQLRNTGFYRENQFATHKLAHGYGGDDEGKTTYEKELTWALIGAGGMVTSTEDLLIWAKALQTGAIFPAGTPNLAFARANERWLLGSLATTVIHGEAIIQMGGSTDYGYTALLQFAPKRDLIIVLLLNAHGSKYQNATHHQLSRQHILPFLAVEPRL